MPSRFKTSPPEQDIRLLPTRLAVRRTYDDIAFPRFLRRLGEKNSCLRTVRV